MTATVGMRQTLAEAATAIARHGVIAVTGLLVTPLVARRLGAEALGAWALMGAGAFLVGLGDLGLCTAVRRGAVTGADPARARRVVGVAVLASLTAAPALALIAVYGLRRIPGASAPLGQDVARALPVLFLAYVTAALSAPYLNFLLVRGGMRALAWSRVGACAAQLGVTLAGLALADTLLAPVAGMLAGAGVEAAMLVRAARRADPGLPLGPRLPADAGELRAQLRDGSATLVLTAIWVAGTRADAVILAQVGALSMVAAYSVAGRAVDQAYTLAKQTSAALLPRLGEVDARDEAVRLGTGLHGALVWSGMVALAVHGQPLLVAWAGPVAAETTTASALALLGAAAALNATHETAASALTLGGRTAWAGALPLALGYVVNVAISVTCARRYGVWAVAGGTLVGQLLAGAGMWIAARRFLGWRWRGVAGSLLPSACAGATSLAVSLALARLLLPTPGGAALACVTATSLGCAAALAVLTRARREGRAGAPSPSAEEAA